MLSEFMVLVYDNLSTERMVKNKQQSRNPVSLLKCTAGTECKQACGAFRILNQHEKIKKMENEKMT